MQHNNLNLDNFLYLHKACIMLNQSNTQVQHSNSLLNINGIVVSIEEIVLGVYQ